MKSAHRKRSDVAEIPIWVEQSYKYRRERIKNSTDYYIDMLLEFIYLTDIKYVSWIKEFKIQVKHFLF